VDTAGKCRVVIMAILTAQNTQGTGSNARLPVKLRITRIIATLAVVQLAGVICFASGFLLSRVQVNMTSSVNRPVKGFDSAFTATQPPPFNRALLLIVDALRLDFLVQQRYSVAGAAHVGAMTQTLHFIQDAVRP
jgi:hypothetical protein